MEIVYVDGACKNNQSSNKSLVKGGYGIFFGKNDPRNFSGKYEGEDPTNNRCELMAIKKALEMIEKEKDILLYTDSEYCVGVFNEWLDAWKKDKKKMKKKKNLDIIFEIDKLIQERDGETVIKYIAAHVGNYGNEDADKLANSGAHL